MNQKNDSNLMSKIVSLCKRRGFIYPASEIYGGFANTFDYGPMGVELKNNIKSEWWKRFVTSRDDIIGLDSAIIQNPKTWEASGHLSSFSDPLVECKKCHLRFREDQINPKSEIRNPKQIQNNNDQNAENDGILNQVQNDSQKCKEGGEHEWTKAKDFNLMFKTNVGPTQEKDSVAYLRPETAQGIFSNFKNVIQSNRVKIPFGIAQIGKAFRNEITPGNFTFRTLEFEQAEIEYFIEPDKENSNSEYKKWIEESEKFFLDLGIKKENVSVREHDNEELSHYSMGTSDIEYNFPFGVSELAGIAQRSDYDLKQHEKHSGQDLQYREEGKDPYIPYVVEPSFGVDRAALAFLVDAYDESDGSDGREKGEVTLRLNPIIAPIKVAVFPLMKKEGLPEIAKKIYEDLIDADIASFYDESGSVGRRYRRQDEIGTPWCVTVDFDTLKDDTVTLRDRDTMKQERVNIEDVRSKIKNQISK
jgi:glycyl-tRNA synthetase